jgi:hypothetical protein
MARPTIKTKKLCESICEGIALGRSSRAVCAEAGISDRTLWNWLAQDEEFMQQYARAKEKCADFYAEEIVEIADDSGFDWKRGKDDEIIVDGDAINRARLRVDARKWYASKLAPKKYGDRVTNEHEGGDPSKPISHNIQVSFVASNPLKP